jgi:serine/threonine-protein kinase
MFPPPDPTHSFPYRILGQVGEGAMGIVYRAQDLELGRSVAIKVIKPSHLASLTGHESHIAVERFLQEARAAAALSHPGATVVHRVGTEGGAPYIVMEWLEGKTLEAHLAERKRLPPDQVARIGLYVLAVLSAAHQLGIIHRDVKPSNLILTKAGPLKLTDFGIARMQGAGAARTQAGAVVGTPRYAAPEQLAGGSVDHRADLYALGGVLYEALCGRPPFESDNLYTLLIDVQSGTPATPSSLVPDLPPGFDAFLLRALAKKPEDRFSSARDMALALQPFFGQASASAVATTLKRTASIPPAPGRLVVQVEAQSVPALVAATVRTWPATPLGRLASSSLLERLLDRPLHAPAFCGAVETKGAVLLLCDGVVYGAFDPATGRIGDEVLEALGAEVDATLHAVPADLDPRVATLLASLLHAPEARLTGLDPSFVDLPQLANKLASEGFDGAVRLVRGPLLGFALFSRGRRILDLFGSGWPAVVRTPWEEWVSRSGLIASVEERRTVYPAFTFRQQLREFTLEVVRPEAGRPQSVRVDTVADAQALELRPLDAAKARLRRGDSTLQSLVTGDPALALARWTLADLPAQFTMYGRSARWKALVEPLAQVSEVRLHHAVPLDGGGEATFDVATYGKDGRLHHLAQRVAAGTAAEVERFVARAVAAKKARERPEELGAAILVAPQFADEALDVYLRSLRTAGSVLLAGLGALTHAEGYLRLGTRRGLHILLVEEAGGRRRPLVPG